MTKRMLINAIHHEECRIAIASDDQLIEFDVEKRHFQQLRGNIYKSTITRIEPSLQAAFLDIGAERNGFLQINDIHPAYFLKHPKQNGKESHKWRPAIQDVLQKGQDLVIQVVKDEREAKGATLTTNLSLPGRYLVLMVGSQRGGVSRKINDESQRFQLRQAVQRLVIPAGMGVIVRTAGINKTYQELQRDLDSLLSAWYRIVDESLRSKTPKLLYQESGLAIRTLRDYLSPSIDEILIDDQKTYNTAKDFISTVMPQWLPKIHHYEESRPLLSKFHLDRQVDEINQAEVTLETGGSIVINITEAVVAIDVNSGRSTGQADVEETAFNTNKEAAETIAKQLRLRDLGGLIVIDFIDMWDRRHRQVVERTLKDSVKSDKAKVEMGRISKFGLLEMSRQRLKASLASQSHIKCPHCDGIGQVKTTESAALEAVRKIQSSVFAGGVKVVKARMAPSAALFLLNEKRKLLSMLEEQSDTEILVYADGRMKPSEYQLQLETESHKTEITSKSLEKRTPASQEKEKSAEGSSDNRRKRSNRRKSRSQSWKNKRGGNRSSSRNWPKKRDASAEDKPASGGGGGNSKDSDKKAQEAKSDKADSKASAPSTSSANKTSRTNEPPALAAKASEDS